MRFFSAEEGGVGPSPKTGAITAMVGFFVLFASQALNLVELRTALQLQDL